MAYARCGNCGGHQHINNICLKHGIVNLYCSFCEKKGYLFTITRQVYLELTYRNIQFSNWVNEQRKKLNMEKIAKRHSEALNKEINR